MITPPYLKSGDEIQIIAPARKIDREVIERTKKVLTDWGFSVSYGDNLFHEKNQFSGTEEERVDDLQKAINNPKVKAILCARGGYGSSQVIDRVDFTPLQTNPKWILGFSDMTAIHGLVNQTGVCSVHSSMPSLFFQEGNKLALETLKNSLLGDLPNFEFENHPLNRTGKIEGELIGGNLSIVNHCLGTPSEYDFNGKILFLEDLDEYLYHIDRMFVQLKRNGIFNQVKGILIGGMTSMHDHDTPFGKNVEEIIADHTQKLPLAFNFPAGHIADNRAIIFGKKVRLTINKENSSLNYVV